MHADSSEWIIRSIAVRHPIYVYSFLVISLLASFAMNRAGRPGRDVMASHLTAEAQLDQFAA
jgi:hypothetical protein